ncbi:MAG: hypothetical protein U9Q33_10770 [Campylobacterota bacterium]|nr:hypothetical protein [Campylobacterota bacterium]
MKLRLLFLSLFFTGCSSLLPSVVTKTAETWSSYDSIQTAYDSVEKYKTTKKDLHNLGFDPYKNSNTMILNHLDIMKRFLVTQSVKIEDLDIGLQECIRSKTECFAYETRMKYLKRKRYGSTLLDIFNFEKNTRETGWSFSSIIVVQNEKVVFKTASSQPKIDNNENRKNPLGPFQSMESILKNTVE